MDRTLTPADEDAILKATEERDALEDKRLMERWGVSRTTLYRARWRALQRRREAADESGSEPPPPAQAAAMM